MAVQVILLFHRNVFNIQSSISGSYHTLGFGNDCLWKSIIVVGFLWDMGPSGHLTLRKVLER